MKYVSFLIDFILVVILSILTQIGGLIFLLVKVLSKNIKNKTRLFFPIVFLSTYSLFTFIIIPPIASSFGRVPLPISKSNHLAPHTYLTVFLNRHYVTPSLKKELFVLADQFEKSNKGIKTIYLDANFPFWNGFPLIPHLSHNDGKKVDLSFIYSKNGILTNAKPSNSGYGHYEGPLASEYSLPKKCTAEGHWQYGLSKYITLGSSNKLTYESQKTKDFLSLILSRNLTEKVFIEPHLAERMRINHSKLRYHGCHSVRHDDHIHLQIK